MSGWIWKLFLKIQRIEYGKRLRLNGLPIIYARKGGKIKFGKNITINSSFLSNLIGLYQRTIIVARDSEAMVNISDNVGLSGVTIYAGKVVAIGKGTFVGGNTKILGYDFHPSNPMYRLQGKNEFSGKGDIIIGDNCFIGCNCIILKGVHIGDNVTVGAGSVVTKDIPANCSAAGNPAVVIKQYNMDRTNRE